MMEQLQALKELAEKVETGEIGMSQCLIHDLFGEGLHYFVNDAFNGSRDAAHSLNKAVLGDRYCTTLTQLWIGNDAKPNRASKDWICKIYKWTGESVEVTKSDAACAELLAIIKAKIAEVDYA